MGESADPSQLADALDARIRRPWARWLGTGVVVLGLVAIGSGYLHTTVVNVVTAWRAIEHPAAEGKSNTAVAAPHPVLIQAQPSAPPSDIPRTVRPDHKTPPRQGGETPASVPPAASTTLTTQAAQTPYQPSTPPAAPPGNTFSWHANHSAFVGNLIVGFDNVDVGGEGTVQQYNTFVGRNQIEAAARAEFNRRNAILGVIFNDYKQVHPEQNLPLPTESFANAELEKMKENWRIRYINAERFVFVDASHYAAAAEAPH